MTRDELEARLWHWLPRATPVVIDAILADVDRHVVTETGLAAQRRAELDAAVSKDCKMIACGCGCGERIRSRDAHGRARHFKQGHSLLLWNATHAKQPAAPAA